MEGKALMGAVGCTLHFGGQRLEFLVQQNSLKSAMAGVAEQSRKKSSKVVGLCEESQ
jgi:hypothetical protein